MQEDNNPNSPPAQDPAQRVRVNREKISQKEIDDAKKRYEHIMRSTADVAREIIEFGDIFLGFKNRMRHGKWLPFLARNFPEISARTVTRFMRAAEQKYDPLLSIDPATFLARMWGNESKQLEEEKKVKKGKSDVTSDLGKDDDEDREGDEETEDEDLKQHGGPGFEPGFFPEKGKPALDLYKNLVGTLDKQFFDVEAYSSKEKLVLIEALIPWLEKRREVLAARAERQEKAEQK